MAGVAFDALQIVNPSDLTTVLFDLDDNDGSSNNPGGVKTNAREFRLRVPPLEAVRFSPPNADGGITTHTRSPLVLSDWKQRLFGFSSFDNGALGCGVLQRLLQLGGVIKYVPKGSANTRYIYYEKSDPLAFFGEDVSDLFHATQLFDFPDGIPLQILRQPHTRGPEINPAANVLTNPLMLLSIANGRPDAYAWDSVTGISAESISSQFEAYEFTAATTATRSLQQTWNTAAPGDVWPASFFASSTNAAIAQARAVVEYLDAASAVLATYTGTLTAIGANVVRLTVVPNAAPANTAKVRVSLRIQNATAGAVVMRFKNAQLEKAAAVTFFKTGPQLIPNDPTGSGGLALGLWVEGDARVPVKVKLKADAGSAIVEHLVGVLSSGGVVGTDRISDYLNTGKVLQLEGGTNGVDSSDVADANGSGAGNNVAEVTYASGATPLQMRKRQDVSTVLLSRRRAWDVYIRCKAMAASQHSLALGLGKAASTITDLFPEVPHDVSTATSFGYVWKYLASIGIPDDLALAALRFEVHTRRDSGTGNLRMDYLGFMPTDAPTGRIFSPTTQLGFWLGRELLTPTSPAGLTAGTIVLNSLKLTATNDAGGTPPNAGMDLGAAHQVVVLDFGAQQVGGTGDKLGELRVRNVTDGVNTKTLDLNGIVGVSYPSQIVQLAFDSVAGKLYQLQVVLTNGTGATIWVHNITRLVQQQVKGDSGQSVLSNPLDGTVNALDTNDLMAFALDVDGVLPMTCSPGLNILPIVTGDVAINGYSEPENRLARIITAQGIYQPRYFQ
jgi:hypothetical protein